MRGSWYPYGFRDYADREDSLAQAEVGRLVLDNSRDPDGRYRRDNAGYFAEIAPMASMGLGFTGLAALNRVAYVDPATTATGTPSGRTTPTWMPWAALGGMGLLFAVLFLVGGDKKRSRRRRC